MADGEREQHLRQRVRRRRHREPRRATRTIRLETGRLAQQAAGAVTIYLGDTMLLCAATASKRPKDNLDFFPLTVDVEERMYAAGKIPGSFFRREGRPSEDAILTCRLTDRPLRPSFKKGLRNEVQIVSTVMALDPDHLYDVLAINGAAAVGAAVRPAVHRPGRRHPRRLRRRRVDRLPEPQRARGGDLRHGRRRPPARRRRRRDHDGRGRGHPRGLRGHRRPAAPRRPRRSSPQGLEAAKPAIAAICKAQKRARRPSRPRSRSSSPSSSTTTTTCSPPSPRPARPTSPPRCRSPASRSARPRPTPSRPRSSRPLAEQFEGREKEVSAAFRSLTKTVVRRRIVKDKARIDGRGLEDIRQLVGRGRGPAARARLGAVRARRDPDPGRHHAEHAAHGADGRHAQPREPQALHAPLQLPAVLHR